MRERKTKDKKNNMKDHKGDNMDINFKQLRRTLVTVATLIVINFSGINIHNLNIDMFNTYNTNANNYKVECSLININNNNNYYNYYNF